mmetsp:Transcript_33891/g.61588  ORF Transcript_33891/g.61588 Transcript_33891/m.61588 type:complete len:228 (-) Transcript_33891:376-1059(-)
MHTPCVETIHAHRTRQCVTAFLRLNKDNGFLTLVHAKSLLEFAVLVEIFCHLNDLLNVPVGSQLQGPHSDLVVVGEEVPGQTLHLLGPGGTPHQRLPVWPDLRHNLADLGLETHVKHAVCLIHHQISHAPQVGLAALKMVNQPTRGCNHNLHTALQIVNLRPLWHATVQARVLDATATTKLVAFDFDLDSELSRWSQDKHNWAITRLQVRLSIDVNHGRQKEGQSFT